MSAISVLPVDLLYIICSYLSQSDVYSKLIYSCKFWKNIILNCMKDNIYVAGNYSFIENRRKQIDLINLKFKYLSALKFNHSYNDFEELFLKKFDEFNIVSLKSLTIQKVYFCSDYIPHDYFKIHSQYFKNLTSLSLICVKLDRSDTAPMLLPENLTYIKMSNMDQKSEFFASLSWPKPLKILHIDQESNGGTLEGYLNLPHVEELSLSLRTLSESNFPLPSSLTKLSLASLRMNTQPYTILLNASLQIEIKAVEKFNLRVPESIKVLHMRHCEVLHDLKLPNSLTELRMAYCFGPLINQIELPATITNLEITNCGMFDMPKLPAILKELTVFGNCISKLPKLPNNLLDLSVNDNQLGSQMLKLPDSLTKLTTSKWSSLPKCLPKNLIYFGVYHHHVIREFKPPFIDFYNNLSATKKVSFSDFVFGLSSEVNKLKSKMNLEKQPVVSESSEIVEIVN